MSRLHLRDDQIHTLDRDTLDSLRDELNEEMCILANVERSIYKRRRTLDLEEDPTLLNDSKYSIPVQEKSPDLTTEELIQALKTLNLDADSLKQFIK
jgi:hypothetical protein